MNDLDINFDGLSLTDFDFEHAKSFLDNMNPEYFSNLETIYFTYDINNNIDLELNNPYK